MTVNEREYTVQLDNEVVNRVINCLTRNRSLLNDILIGWCIDGLEYA